MPVSEKKSLFWSDGETKRTHAVPSRPTSSVASSLSLFRSSTPSSTPTSASSRSSSASFASCASRFSSFTAFFFLSRALTHSCKSGYNTSTNDGSGSGGSCGSTVRTFSQSCHTCKSSSYSLRNDGLNVSSLRFTDWPFRLWHAARPDEGSE